MSKIIPVIARILVAAALLFPAEIFAQSDISADYAAGKKLYAEKNYESAVSSFYKALWAVHKQKDKNSDYYANEKTILGYIDSSYAAAEKENIAFTNVEFDTTKTDEFYYFVTDVSNLTADSATITINVGKQDGIYWDAECTLVGASSSKPEDTGRSLKYLGGARIVELSDYMTRLVVKFYKKRKGSQIYLKDLVEVKPHLVKNAHRSMVYELSRLNIGFNDNSNDQLLYKRVIMQNTNPALAEVLIELYAWEINDFSSVLEGLDDSTFTVKYKKGKFRGYNLKQIFPITSGVDIEAFFNFVNTYPGKYMGKNWKINETYATWVLNFTPTGDKDRKWLIPAIIAKDIRSLDDLLKKTAWYISEDSLLAWGKDLDDYINAGDMTLARSFCDKLLYISQYLGDSASIAYYYYRQGLLSNADGNKKEALSEMLMAWNMYPDNTDYIYMLASLYGQNERFDSCFYLYELLLKKYPESYVIKGNLGWYKTLAGKLDEATPLCREAYLADTSSTSYAVNYGHTFLLRGNVDSAKYFYRKMLDNLNHPTDYTEGPKKDFEIFFSKGWQRKAIAEIAEWLDNEFKDKYSVITQGNDIWDDAKKHYNSKDYVYAIRRWKEYLTLFEKVKDIKQLEIHNTNAWIGICYANLKMRDSAEKYYENALLLGTTNFVNKRNKDPENDVIAEDYKRMYNFYDGKDQKKADAYKTIYDAEIQKLTEINSASQLFVLCIGGKDSAGSKTYQNDAKFFFDNITALSGKQNNDSGHIYIDGSNLTKKMLIKKLEDIRRQSKPEDIFIFYYAGLSGRDTGKEKETLYFNPGDEQSSIGVTELTQTIDLVYARKKMIITSEPDPMLLNLITTQYTSATNLANEIIFICPGVKTPVMADGHTMFTHELVSALTEMKKKDQFSAKEYIDKAAYELGRGMHYLPVLSFTYGKDFILYKNDSLRRSVEIAQTVDTRGLDVNSFTSDDNEPESNNPTVQKNYALFFASDQYDDNNTWHNLSNPVSDATALANMLRDDYGFETELVKNASKKEIENKLRQYRIKNFGPNDQLMIFFAGHGIYYQEANMGYLVARDSKDPRSTDPNYNTYLSYSDLGNLYLKNIKCKRIFLVLDACYAGSFFEENTYHRGIADMQATDANVMQRLNMLKKNASGKSFYKGISSGGRETVEDGKKDQHSPFAAGLIQMLNNAIPNYYITADAIIGEIQNYHPGNTTPSSGTFNYSDPQGLFIFEVNVKEHGVAIRSDNLKR